ncbi:MAG: hypothetical protein ACP5SG_02225 [Dissulfurimicrobium sp.]|uniref:hypothetical protein n=1 Tax=Dissulfurimicrobium TaxID=1769732 RepID=UPI003C70F468
MKHILVRRGGIAVSSSPDTWLVARSLGSTLCVCVKDQTALVSAMTVIVLPRAPSGIEGDAGLEEVALDAPGGLTRLMRGLMKRGAKRENLNIWLVGAAKFIEEPSDMALGAQIYTAVRTILQGNRVMIQGEHVGGQYNRSVKMIAGKAGGPLVTAPGLREVSL